MPKMIAVPFWRSAAKTPCCVSGRPTGLDREVCAGAAGNLRDRLDDAVARGVDRVRRAELLRHVEAVVVAVGDDDLAGAGAGDEVGEGEADGPLTEDHDALAEDAAHLLHGVHHGADRLTQHPQRRVALVRHRHSLARRDAGVLQQPARLQGDDALTRLQALVVALFDDADGLVARRAGSQG